MRLPDPRNINRENPSGKQTMSFAGTAGVGAISEELGGFAADLLGRRTDYQVAEAQSDFLKLKSEQDNAYDNDPEYDTINPRYVSTMQEGLDSAASKIADGQKRQKFINQNGIRIETGKNRINAVAFAKERDVNRARINEQLTALNQVGLDGEFGEADDTAQQLLRTAAGLGYYSEEEAGRMSRAWKDRLAVDKIGLMEPEQRISALSEPWSKNLPPAVRSKLLEKARADSAEVRAISIADDMIGRGLSVSEAAKESRKIKNPKLRKEAERRFDYLNSKQRAAKVEGQGEVVDKYFLDLRRGELSIDDIPKEELEILEPGQINALYSAQGQAFGGSAKTDRESLTDFHEILGSKGKQAAKEYLLENSNRFSDGDYEQYLTKVSGGYDAKPEISLQQEVSALLGESVGTKAAKKDKGQVLLEYNEWSTDYQKRNNKEPSAEERSKQLARSVIEVKYKKEGAWVGSKDRLYEMSFGDKAEAVRSLSAQDPVRMQKIVSDLQVRGLDMNAKVPEYVLDEIIGAMNE